MYEENNSKLETRSEKRSNGRLAPFVIQLGAKAKAKNNTFLVAKFAFLLVPSR